MLGLGRQVTDTPVKSRRLKYVIGAAVVVVVAAGYAYNYSHGTWSRLRSEAEEFGIPAGFTKVESRESGTTFCFVSCNGTGGPVIVAEYQSERAMSEREACGAIGEHLEAIYPDVKVQPWGDELPVGLDGCAHAYLRSVGEYAYLYVTNGCRGANADDVEPGCVTVSFASGLS